MRAAEVEAFLSHLTVDGNVAASTQNLALSALLFLYRDVLGVELPWMSGVIRAKRPAASLGSFFTLTNPCPALQRGGRGARQASSRKVLFTERGRRKP